MIKRYFAFLLTALLLSACTTTTPSSPNPSQRAADINRDADRAMESLRSNVQGADELLAKARGVVIFPSVLSAALMVGGSRGDGVLRVNGQPVSYHTITSGSFGFQAGVRSAAMFLLFMTDESLQQFQSGKRDWSAGVDASVTVVSAGLTAQATTTTLQQPVIGFVLANRGLMAGVSFDGSRISPLNLQN
jgi:lipid-binding SYLF domain-containing protein